MSSRQVGTWPQLIGCALFEIWSLILDSELKEQKGYSTGRLSVQEISTDKQKMAEGFQDAWKGKLGRLRWMGEAESGGCQNAGILLDNRRGMDLRANNNFGNSDGKTGNELLCLVDRWALGLSL